MVVEYNRVKIALVKEKMERLLKDEEIEVPINLETVINGIENNKDNIWILLIDAGYLKVIEIVDSKRSVYKVRIPNKETKEVLKLVLEQSERYGEPVIPTELRNSNDKFLDVIKSDSICI